MPDIPTLQDYITRHANYQQFIALAFVLGAIGAPMLRRGNGLAIGLKLWHIMGLGGVLRVPLLFQNYWYDEAFTSTLTRANWRDMFTAIAGDVHPPLYYSIVKLFTSILGHNDIAMRLPAFLSSVGLIWAMFVIGKQHGGERVGRWAALGAAILPAALYYGAEARYPAFLALMLAIAYIQIQRGGRWAGVALAVAALSHVNAWFYVLVMCAALLLNWRWGQIILPCVAVGAWLPIAALQAGDVGDGFWLLQSLPIRHVIDMSITARFTSVSAWSVLGVMVPLIAMLAAAVWAWRRQAGWLWLACAVGVPALQWLVGIVWNPLYLERTLLFSALLLLVPVGAWLDRHSTRALAALGAVCIAAGVLGTYTYERSYMPAVIASCEGRTVYATNTHTAILARHYTSSDVIVFEGGNTTSQQLPTAARRVLFDGLTTANALDEMCLVAKIDNFTTQQELAHIESIAGNVRIFQNEQLPYFYITKTPQEGRFITSGF